jgi:hypothetical protein
MLLAKSNELHCALTRLRRYYSGEVDVAADGVAAVPGGVPVVEAGVLEERLDVVGEDDGLLDAGVEPPVPVRLAVPDGDGLTVIDLVAVPPVGLAVAGGEVVVWVGVGATGSGVGLSFSGAGARNMSCAGRWSRSGSAPAAAAIAVPPTTTPTPSPTAATPALIRRRTCGGAAGAGLSCWAARKCANASVRPAISDWDAGPRADSMSLAVAGPASRESRRRRIRRIIGAEWHPGEKRASEGLDRQLCEQRPAACPAPAQRSWRPGRALLSA